MFLISFSAPPTCPKPNQMFSTCNDQCQPTCTTIFKPTKKHVTGCIPVCTIPGCVCVPGYVKNAAGDCVRPDDCRK